MSNNLAYLSVRLITAFGAVKLIPWLSVKTVAIRGCSGCGFNGADRILCIASYPSPPYLESDCSEFGGQASRPYGDLSGFRQIDSRVHAIGWMVKAFTFCEFYRGLAAVDVLFWYFATPRFVPKLEW